MTVRELIETLRRMDPDAEARLPAGEPVVQVGVVESEPGAVFLFGPGAAVPSEEDYRCSQCGLEFGVHTRPGVGYDEPPTVHCPNCGGSLVRRAEVTPFEDITRAIHAGRYDGEGGIALFRCDVLARFGGGHADLHAAFLKFGESRAPLRERLAEVLGEFVRRTSGRQKG
jgi:DNA-directed RNA polymerase subunit RPC12/RpoP